MWVLEIAMLLVGCFAVVYSVRLSEKNKDEEKTTERVEYLEYADFPEKEWKEKIKQLKEEAEEVYQEVDDKISRLSNEKIMGMHEYSDQVLDKIEKNHGEVVFLYDMMNEKQEEIKKTVNEVDTMRAGIKNDTEKEFQKLLEKEEALDQMKQDIEMESLNIQAKQKEIMESQKEMEERQKKIEESQKEIEESQKDMEERQRVMQASKMEPDIADRSGEVESRKTRSDMPQVTEEKKQEKAVEQEEKRKEAEEGAAERMPEKVSVSDVIDAEIARIEEEEANEKRERETEGTSGYQPLSAQKKPENHNDEIIELYKKGRSILEISRMLALGQGEVKFVIDLYKARL